MKIRDLLLNSSIIIFIINLKISFKKIKNAEKFNVQI